MQGGLRLAARAYRALHATSGRIYNCKLPGYTASMIRSFRHKGLGRLFLDEDPKGVRADLVARCLRRLDAIDQAVRIDDLRLPGFSLHELKGIRRGIWSIHVNGPYCITFRFLDGDAFDVDLENYH